ncbi:hypothetical protein FACS1894125_2460 [Actinomycetota bacterium]|nr:hypothetical protein FACS1894125_2460 [Actinomycetota bacterium]
MKKVGIEHIKEDKSTPEKFRNFFFFSENESPNPGDFEYGEPHEDIFGNAVSATAWSYLIVELFKKFGTITSTLEEMDTIATRTDLSRTTPEWALALAMIKSNNYSEKVTNIANDVVISCGVSGPQEDISIAFRLLANSVSEITDDNKDAVIDQLVKVIHFFDSALELGIVTNYPEAQYELQITDILSGVVLILFDNRGDEQALKNSIKLITKCGQINDRLRVLILDVLKKYNASQNYLYELEDEVFDWLGFDLSGGEMNQETYFTQMDDDSFGLQQMLFIDEMLVAFEDSQNVNRLIKKKKIQLQPQLKSTANFRSAVDLEKTKKSLQSVDQNSVSAEIYLYYYNLFVSLKRYCEQLKNHI